MIESVQYGWLPPAQQVGGGAVADITVPPGYIHQTAWKESGGADIRGVYAHPTNAWNSMIWRWADTMRSASIHVVNGPPAYRIEVAPADTASPGTSGNNPRAELMSVDPEEKRRRRQPPPGAFLRDGAEYWATFALYIPSDFPKNHWWATLFQRKFDDVEGSRTDRAGNPLFLSWFTVNVHGTDIDVTIPGNNGDVYQKVATLNPSLSGNLPSVMDRWTQFLVHERLSSGNDGLAEIYINGTLVSVKSGKPTVRPGDVNYHFQFGYYRTNTPRAGESQGPGTGVLYCTPLLIKRGSAQVGNAPKLP